MASGLQITGARKRECSNQRQLDTKPASCSGKLSFSRLKVRSSLSVRDAGTEVSLSGAGRYVSKADDACAFRKSADAAGCAYVAYTIGCGCHRCQLNRLRTRRGCRLLGRCLRVSSATQASLAESMMLLIGCVAVYLCSLCWLRETIAAARHPLL